MSQSTDPVPDGLGPFVAQGLAIQARLQTVFPAKRYYFKVLPPKLNARKWGELTQGNQPFLGLGFNGFLLGKMEQRELVGQASWMVLVAVRRASATDQERYFGDKQGLGALTLASVVAPLLNGFLAATGTVVVTGVQNVAADDWGDDAVIIKVDLLVPATLRLSEAITAPGGLGLFEEMASTWNWPAQDGTAGTFTSTWDNPNGQD
jgi:hypothetical protein